MTTERASLRRSLRRAERRRFLGGLALTLPLLAFLLVFFALPIVGMLQKSVENPEVASVLPETAAALQAWTGLPCRATTISPGCSASTTATP